MPPQRTPPPAAAVLSARHGRRGLAVVFAATFLELVGYFMLVPLMAIVLADRGFGPAFIGLFGAMPWLGILCATPFVARLVHRLGRGAALWISGAVPLVAGLGFLVTDSIPVWFALWFAGGLASALRWIVAEATVAEFAPAANRGRWVGLFESMVGSTFVVGPALLWATGTDGALPFAASAACIAAGLAVLVALPRLPREGEAHGDEHGDAVLGVRGVWAALRASPVVMAVGFVGGFFESGLSGLLPVWGLALGWGAALAALLVAASGAGSALAMVPVGEAADRLGRRPVMLACALTVLAGALLLPAVSGAPALAWAVAFAWGGAGGALYTLAMIDLGDRTRGLALMNATSVLVLSYTAGGALAPLAGGTAMQWAPTLGLPALLTAVAAGGVVALLRSPRGLAMPADARPVPSAPGQKRIARPTCTSP
jgi:MFS family permease